MDRLAVIVADMVKSALSWEEDHGVPQHDNRKIKPPKALTVIGVTGTLNTSKNVAKGENNDHHD